jgi:hypothetical protein
MLARESSKLQADSMRQMIQVISQPFGRQSSALKNSDLMRKVGALEKKLSAYSQSVFQQMEEVESRKRESQYTTLLNEVMANVTQINEVLVQIPYNIETPQGTAM